MTKRDRAIELRDIALRVVRQRGTWEPVGPSMRMLSFRDGDLGISLRTPFQRLSEPPASVRYVAALSGQDASNLPCGLDVWCPKKVLNIEWADDGRVLVVSLKRGDWEQRLSALA
jgi:hypothetical protein